MPFKNPKDKKKWDKKYYQENKEEKRKDQRERYYKNREYNLKMKRQYHSSIRGIATKFRAHHNFMYDDSLLIARKCVDDFQRCEICGLLQWWNRVVLKNRGIYLRGDERVNRRLVPDHIIPGTDSRLENIRILCYACNDIRGAAIKTDIEVLHEVRWWYKENFSLRDLWWLNETPGKGGTIFRNKYMKHKAEKLTGRVFND
jgi:hypothetical protein